MSAFSQSAYGVADFASGGILGYQGAYGGALGMQGLNDWAHNVGGGIDFERSVYLANLDRAFNSQEALLNRQWEEYMSNTAYQRQVEDMRKAGINPYMALGGGGASTPSASPASSRSTAYQSSGANFGNLLVNVLGKVVGGAFGIATTALNNERLENLAELKQASAYDMQSRRFDNQRERDLLKHEFNKTYKYMDLNRATAPRESHVWHYNGNRKR